MDPDLLANHEDPLVRDGLASSLTRSSMKTFALCVATEIAASAHGTPGVCHHDLLDRLEADGLCRSVFGMENYTGGAWDRRVFTLRNARGRAIASARPGAFDWNRLPGLRGIQYVIPVAVFARPNEMLRFRLLLNTPYAEYWDDFPTNIGASSASTARS